MKQLFLFFFCVFSLALFAQKEANHWSLGRGYHLDFSTESPSFTRDLDTTTYSGATISDSTGKLLFYTNGETVWNADGTVADNGTAIGGWDGTSRHVAIVPIAYTNRYYIFNRDADSRLVDLNTGNIGHYTKERPLSYSLVEFVKGKAIVLQKNQVLLSPALLAMGITLAENKEDIWLVTIDNSSRSDSLFVAYRLNSCGVTDTVYSFTEVDTAYFYGSKYASDKINSLSISPNGKHLLHNNYFYDFDNQTGQLTLVKMFSDDDYYPYMNTPVWTNDSKNFLTIASSIPNTSWTINYHQTEDVKELCVQKYNDHVSRESDYQLGPDGHFYYSKDRYTEYGIERINTNKAICPNLSVDIVKRTFPTILTIPFFPNYFFDPNYKSPPKEYPLKVATSRICEGNATSFSLVSDNKTIFQYAVMGNGDTLYPTSNSFDYTYSQSGIYNGFFVCERKCFTQKVPFTVIVDTDPVLNLESPYTFYHCKEQGVQLVIDDVFNTSVLWSDDSTSFERFFTESGDYEVTIKNTCGTLTENFHIEELLINNVPNIITPNGDNKNDILYIENLAEGSQFTVYNRWGKTVFTTDNYQNEWPTEQLQAGVYYYELVVEDNCRYKGWVTVQY